MRQSMFVFLALSMMVVSPLVVSAHEGHDHGAEAAAPAEGINAEAAPAAEVVVVDNKICPVSKESNTDMGEPYEITYNGKTYKLCCEMCAQDFMNDPEKYSKLADEEVAAPAAETVTQ